MTEKEVLKLLQYVQKRDNMYLDNESDVADLLKEMNKKQFIENHS